MMEVELGQRTDQIAWVFTSGAPKCEHDRGAFHRRFEHRATGQWSQFFHFFGVPNYGAIYGTVRSFHGKPTIRLIIDDNSTIVLNHTYFSSAENPEFVQEINHSAPSVFSASECGLQSTPSVLGSWRGCLKASKYHNLQCRLFLEVRFSQTKLLYTVTPVRLPFWTTRNLVPPIDGQSTKFFPV